MSHPVILAACRTPIGKFHGGLSSLSASELGAVAIGAALERSGLPTTQVEEVILGNVLSAGVGQAPARQTALKAGLPPSVAAVTVNKVCGSGLKAVMLAAQAIRAGDAHVIVAGGTESMSRAPYLLTRDGPTFGDRTLSDAMLTDGLVCPFSGRSMGQIAETLATAEDITRADQDAYACESHRRASQARTQGAFDNELVPVSIETRIGTQIISHDEGPRADCDLPRLAQLRPAFRDDGTVTPGNSSTISDGAAAIVVTSQEFATSHGFRPLVRIVACATSGTEPGDLFIAPVIAIQKVLQLSGLTIKDIDLFEINEAFAVQMVTCLRRLDLSPEKTNIHGGAISLGHPLGASGARVLTTLVHAMHRQKARFGIASLCLGGGNAVAMLVERECS